MAQYPAGTVRALLKTDQVTDATRRILIKRLDATPCTNPTFFTATEFTLLQAVCDRLIPQTDRPEYIDIAGGIDERLSENKTNGWRYDTMPSDHEAYQLGLKGIDESAQILFDQPFGKLSDEQQGQILRSIQFMEAPGETWQHLPPERFFEELLAEAAEIYYSHPIALETIGYVGMADVPTWQRIGLNQLEDREPKEL
ncbi:gluconate 2-dehydrogenase subunit 3 family protein [Spirosoma soli]|uniref:Gluconate 2-dehydrogenase subunit 3 family protein n=1 Tax=Spirosoma soli TaxID=1770529 RepID=A0ABW5MAC8_9BACT